MTSPFEFITYQSQTMAIIVRENFHKQGIHFFTPNDYSQQLAYMSHPTGKEIQPHVHKKVQREVHYTQETLFIRKGKLQVDFYSDDSTIPGKQSARSGRCDPSNQRWSWV